MSEWSTACGWTFARRSAQISLVTDPLLNSLKCNKCMAMKGLRDDVKGGISPAQMMAADLKQLSGAKLTGDKKMSQHCPFKKRRVESGQGSQCAKLP